MITRVSLDQVACALEYLRRCVTIGGHDQHARSADLRDSLVVRVAALRGARSDVLRAEAAPRYGLAAAQLGQFQHRCGGAIWSSPLVLRA